MNLNQQPLPSCLSWLPVLRFDISTIRPLPQWPPSVPRGQTTAVRPGKDRLDVTQSWRRHISTWCNEYKVYRIAFNTQCLDSFKQIFKQKGKVFRCLTFTMIGRRLWFESAPKKQTGMWTGTWTKRRIPKCGVVIIRSRVFTYLWVPRGFRSTSLAKTTGQSKAFSHLPKRGWSVLQIPRVVSRTALEDLFQVSTIDAEMFRQLWAPTMTPVETLRRLLIYGTTVYLDSEPSLKTRATWVLLLNCLIYSIHTHAANLVSCGC